MCGKRKGEQKERETERRQGRRRHFAITHMGRSVMWISHSLEGIMLCIGGQESLA